MTHKKLQGSAGRAPTPDSASASPAIKAGKRAASKTAVGSKKTAATKSARHESVKTDAKDPRPHGETRTALLKAAAVVFAKNGFDGTTVKDLADAAGVNVSMVSYYFGGKEALFKTVLENFGMERVAAAEHVLKAPRSFDELALRLTLFAEGFFGIYFKEPDIIKIIHRSVDFDTPLTRDLFENVFSRVFLALQAFAEAGQKAGLLKPEFNPEIATSCLFGSLVHFIRCDPLAKRAGENSIADPAYMDQVIKTWLGVHLGGLSLTPDAQLLQTKVEKKHTRFRKQEKKS